MPSSALLELREEPLPAKRSLDESLALISKKKITKKEIDEQSLLHRAADAGECIELSHREDNSLSVRKFCTCNYVSP